ncbi:hypothetical protein RT723_14225 [Psychrosphaera aquimarina]|uniref:Uncharacterized protein n=1 Tax=Psychrosphaera aquimarina TaxID=2044854 RepID=A0ABU3R371_9GAMM|nr:hypothetical protein [Psychrosphaera aquimarina]MDU0114127.1 hypothetical protein [Psychrosphaera aquimarina]
MSLVKNFIDRMFNLTKFISYGLLILIVVVSIILITEPSMACSTNYDYQKSRVVEHIESKGWSTEHLSPIENPKGECEAMFLFKNDQEHIQYTVAGGYKVTWWDFNERGE